MRRDGLQATPENLTVLAPHRALLAARLFCVPAQSSVQAFQRDRNECIALTDRPCLLSTSHRCDAHSDTSDDTHSPTRRDAKRSRREPQEGDHTASRSVDHVARSMPASAWRTPWTVAKPKTPAVAVRWRERRRSRPHPSRRRPNLTRNNPTQPQPNPTRNNPTQSTILKLGPQAHKTHSQLAATHPELAYT